MSELAYEYEAVNTARAMGRLLENEDFQKIFVKDFMEESLVFLGYNFASNPQSRNEYAEQIIARKHLRDFIDSIMQNGVSAQKAIDYVELNQGEEYE